MCVRVSAHCGLAAICKENGLESIAPLHGELVINEAYSLWNVHKSQVHSTRFTMARISHRYWVWAETQQTPHGDVNIASGHGRRKRCTKWREQSIHLHMSEYIRALRCVPLLEVHANKGRSNLFSWNRKKSRMWWCDVETIDEIVNSMRNAHSARSNQFLIDANVLGFRVERYVTCGQTAIIVRRDMTETNWMT